ncbi:MAG: peptidoglycan-binding protein, partial [Bacillales bacterium]|nr:peptidoglycan-binding protein [Bacillales bacterium]
MVSHPVNTSIGIYSAVTNYKQTTKVIVNGVQQGIEDFINGDAETRGRITGRVVGKITLAVIGGKGIDKAAKAAKSSNLTGRALEVIGNESGHIGIKGTGNAATKQAIKQNEVITYK